MSGISGILADNYASVVIERLSDGSHAFNVELQVDGSVLRIAALSERHADELVVAINRAAWVEIEEVSP